MLNFSVIIVPDDLAPPEAKASADTDVFIDETTIEINVSIPLSC